MNLLEKIGSIIITIGVAVSSLFGGVPQAPTKNVGSTVPQAPALFETSLQASIGSSDTSMTLVANSLKNGNALSGYACFTIDEGLSNVEYVCGTVASTAVSGMTRGVDPLSGTTTVASLQFAHRRGADVKITDYPIVGILSRIASGVDGFPGPVHYDSNPTFSSSTQLVSMKYVDDATSSLSALVVHTTGNETVAGIKSFTSLPTIPLTPVANTDAASKGYADSLTFAGAPNAATSTKGIVQIPTRTDLANITAIGSTGAYLAIPAAFATTTGAGATTSIVMTNSSGNIDSTFLNSTTFGSGSDGDVTVAANSTTTLTRDMFYNNLTVNGALVTGNWRVFVKNTLSGSGVIKQDGTVGNSGSGATGGVAVASTTGYFTGCSSGQGADHPAGSGAGVAGANSGASMITFTTALSGQAGAGGAGNAGAGGGAGTVGANTGTSTMYGVGTFSSVFDANTNSTTSTSVNQIFRLTVGSCGSGGGSGGTGAAANSGGGGSGGTVGGVVFVAANNFGGTFTLRAIGREGGNGGNAVSADSGGGGGGGGGKGGIVIPIYGASFTWSGSCVVTGGGTSSGGTGNNGQPAGSSGSAGAAGMCIPQISISNLIR